MQTSQPDFPRDQILFHTPMGDVAYFANESLIIEFAGKRGVVSASNLNGGYRTDLRYAFNQSIGKRPEIQQRRCPGMKGKNLMEHYAITAEEIGLPASITTGMGTAALIENMALSEREYHGVKVMAVATAGIDVNGGRAGDPAAYDEFERKSLVPPPGTINIFLFINARLDGGALTRAVMTATEAKTTALQELMAPSRYSEGLATGSGTDTLIAICNEESETVLYNAGKHVLLGEMIGRTVKEAVTEALDKQTGMNPSRQSSFLWQGLRYNITKERIQSYCKHIRQGLDDDTLASVITDLKSDNLLCTQMFAILHLIDQHRWGMVSLDSLKAVAQPIIDEIRTRYDLSETLDLDRERLHTPSPDTPSYKLIISDIILLIARIIIKRI